MLKLPHTCLPNFQHTINFFSFYKSCLVDGITIVMDGIGTEIMIGRNGRIVAGNMIVAVNGTVSVGRIVDVQDHQDHQRLQEVMRSKFAFTNLLNVY